MASVSLEDNMYIKLWCAQYAWHAQALCTTKMQNSQCSVYKTVHNKRCVLSNYKTATWCQNWNSENAELTVQLHQALEVFSKVGWGWEIRKCSHYMWTGLSHKWQNCNVSSIQGVPKKIVHSDFFTPWHDNELLQQQGSTSQPIFGI